MTIFEFLSVAASIVLALGLGKLISSIPYVFDAHNRDWLHAMAFATLIAGHILAWWRIWPLNSVAHWNILGFAILMGTPLSLYLAATALVSSSPDLVASWKEHFSETSRWLFSALIAVWVFGILRSYILLNLTPVWWSLLMLGAFVVAAISSRRNIHIVVLSMLLLVFAALIFRSFDADQNLISQTSFPHFTIADPQPNKSLHWPPDASVTALAKATAAPDTACK